MSAVSSSFYVLYIACWCSGCSQRLQHVRTMTSWLFSPRDRSLSHVRDCETRNSSGDEIAKREFLHILASPGYAHETIAINVTWMERGFNAGRLKRIVAYPSIFNRLRADSEILVGNFSYPLHLTPPLGVIPLDDLRDFWWVSCRMARLQYGAKISPKS